MRPPFEDLRQRLLRGGVAPRHVRRYLAELEDHYADLVAAEGSDAAARARLGSIDALAEHMIARPELQSWTARAPWVTLVLAPPLVMVAVIFASVWLVVGVGALIREATGSTVLPGWAQVLASLVTGFEIYVLPILLGWSLAYVALSRGLAPLWPVIGITVLGLLSGGADFQITLKAEGGGTIQVGYGFASPWPNVPESLVHGLINTAATLLPYLFLVRRQRIRALSGT